MDLQSIFQKVFGAGAQYFKKGFSLRLVMRKNKKKLFLLKPGCFGLRAVWGIFLAWRRPKAFWRPKKSPKQPEGQNKLTAAKKFFLFFLMTFLSCISPKNITLSGKMYDNLFCLEQCCLELYLSGKICLESKLCPSRTNSKRIQNSNDGGKRPKSTRFPESVISGQSVQISTQWFQVCNLGIKYH